LTELKGARDLVQEKIVVSNIIEKRSDWPRI